jgi:hypothetical protein
VLRRTAPALEEAAWLRDFAILGAAGETGLAAVACLTSAHVAVGGENASSFIATIDRHSNECGMCVQAVECGERVRRGAVEVGYERVTPGGGQVV